MSLQSTLVKAAFTTAVSLNTKVAGSVTSAASLQLPINGGLGIEWESLSANVSAALTTNTIVVATRWEVSNDGTVWLPLFGLNAPANVAVAPAGNGGAVVTAYAHAAAGINPAYQFIRLACLNTVATGGAADIVTISYNYRRRMLLA